MRLRTAALVVAGIGLVVLAACSSGASEPTPSPTSSPSPTPTASPTPTLRPQLTATEAELKAAQLMQEVIPVTPADDVGEANVIIMSHSCRAIELNETTERWFVDCSARAYLVSSGTEEDLSEIVVSVDLYTGAARQEGSR